MKKMFLTALVLSLTVTTAFAADTVSQTTKSLANGLYLRLKQGHETPASVPGVKTVNTKEAKKLVDSGAVVIDSRPKAYYNMAHLPGAIWVYDTTLLTDSSVIDKFDINKSYLIYCTNVKCPRSAVTAAVMVDKGFKKVYWMRDGIIEWDKVGYPVIKRQGVTGVPTKMTL